MLDGWIIDASNGSMTSVPSAMAVRISRSDKINGKPPPPKAAHYALRPGWGKTLEGLLYMLHVRGQEVQPALPPHEERTVDQPADDQPDPGPFQQAEPEDDREQKHDQEGH